MYKYIIYYITYRSVEKIQIFDSDRINKTSNVSNLPNLNKQKYVINRYYI